MSNHPLAAGLRSPDGAVVLAASPRQASTYDEMREQLGSDNFARIVSNIGERLKSYGLEQAGIPIAYAIDRVLQTLTPSERLSMAQSNTIPPSAEAIIKSEAEAAKNQQRELEAAYKRDREVAAAMFGALAGFGFGPNATRGMPQAANDTLGSSSRYKTLSNDGADGVGITLENFARSTIGRTGLTYLTYAQLQKEGWNHHEIQTAAKGLKEIVGLPPGKVTQYTPFFVGLRTEFMQEAGEVRKSNGKKRFKESDNVSEALAQARMVLGKDITQQQANQLGQMIYQMHQNGKLDMEELRRRKTNEEKWKYIQERGLTEEFKAKGFDPEKLADPDKSSREKTARAETEKQSGPVASSSQPDDDFIGASSEALRQPTTSTGGSDPERKRSAKADAKQDSSIGKPGDPNARGSADASAAPQKPEQQKQRIAATQGLKPGS